MSKLKHVLNWNGISGIDFKPYDAKKSNLGIMGRRYRFLFLILIKAFLRLVLSQPFYLYRP